MKAKKPKVNPNAEALFAVDPSMLKAHGLPIYTEYKYAVPTVLPLQALYVVDCYIVDQQGNVAPGIETPVPINVALLSPVQQISPFVEGLKVGELDD